MLWAAIVTTVAAGVVGWMWRAELKAWGRHLLGRDRSELHVDLDRREYPVKGIDVSHFNGDIDFARVAADSVEFVMIKATEGVTHVDSRLDDNWRGATDNGLKVGFYHFFRFDRGGVKQGRHFLRTIGDRRSDLPLVIDVETAGNPEVDYYRVVGRLRDLLGYLRRHGRRVMIYSNPETYDTYIRGNFDDVDLWMASARTAHANGDDRSLWQHSHNGHVDGIATEVDINTFNGTREAFAEWLGTPDSTAVKTTAETVSETAAPAVSENAAPAVPENAENTQ